MRNPSGVQRADYDGAWKEALHRYFEPFLRLCFPAVHAGIDWSRGFTPLDQDRAMLEREDNPAALVILAHRAAQERTRDPVERKALKWALTRPLYERGYSKEDILELFRLIDWLVRLPQEQEIEFRRQVAEYEAHKHMPYITSIERLGREEGLQQGRQEGRQEGIQQGRQEGRQEGFVAARQKAVLDALEIRFGQVPDGIRERIAVIQDEPRLGALHKSAIQAGSIEEFIRTL